MQENYFQTSGSVRPLSGKREEGIAVRQTDGLDSRGGAYFCVELSSHVARALLLLVLATV